MSYTVTLKGGSPWGFRFQGGCDFHEPIKVAKINSNSKAYKEGLKVGDIIDAINGQKTAGLLHNDVQQLIKCATKELVLDLTSHTPMMNGQMNGDIHPIEEQIITGKTSKDDYKPMSYNTTQTLTTTTDSYSTSSHPGVTSTSSVKVNVSPYRVGQKNEEDKPSHEIQSTMNGSHISSNYSPTKSNQSLHEQSSPQRLTSHADKPVISNVAPIWNPKKGAIFQKKEYKPIKLDTLGMSTMEIQKQHEENQKQEELNIIPPPPEESYSCQQPENEELHEFKSFVSYTPQSNVSDTPQTSRDQSDQAPPEQPPHYHPDPPQKDYMFSNGEFDSEEPSRLPPTQSPFVTLLRKGREGQLPKGAVYIGEQDTLEDGVKHTDTFYAVPTTEEDMSLQSPTSPSEKKPLKYDGIGPTDDKGMPLSFRMNVDEKNQHEWYKQMYRSLHTTKKKEDHDPLQINKIKARKNQKDHDPLQINKIKVRENQKDHDPLQINKIKVRENQKDQGIKSQ